MKFIHKVKGANDEWNYATTNDEILQHTNKFMINVTNFWYIYITPSRDELRSSRNTWIEIV